MNTRLNTSLLALSLAVIGSLSGCGGSGGATSVSSPMTVAPGPTINPPVMSGTPAGPSNPPVYAPVQYVPPTTCADSSTPIAAAVTKASVTENIPSDFDSTAKPTPTSTIFFSVLMPAHCPGDTFPVILHSHGYGGTRITSIAANGTLKPTDSHFSSINSLIEALPYYGYMVISYDERGHGDSFAANARIIDPAAEIQDARAILDYAYDKLPVQKQDATTGITKDFNVATIGYSYGGGFEFALAALDSRIDTIVPNGTWNDLLYSLLPGDGVKLSFDGLLCLLASTATTSASPNTGVHNTPLVQSLCNQVGVQGPMASTLRARSDLVKAMSMPTAYPRSVAETELNDFFFKHGSQYFLGQDLAGKPYGFAGNPGPLRKVPTLLLQGNRDVLFNMSEGWRNATYFGSTGADVRLLTTEGGHMNPLAQQVEGTADCGKYQGVNSILAWFDFYLKGIPNSAVVAIPKVCISVANTVGAPAAAAGLLLNAMPVGSQTGTGGIPASAATLTATVAVGASPVFLPITTIAGSGQVLAGIPRLTSITVTPGQGAIQSTVAYMGVGIQRAGKLILVDDQVTPFVQGTHTNNRGVNNAEVDLTGVGEMLQNGDVVGLILYENHIQYSAVVSAASAPNLPFVIGSIAGLPIPAIAVGPALPNPYSVSITGAELPILTVGVYPGSVLSQ